MALLAFAAALAASRAHAEDPVTKLQLQSAAFAGDEVRQDPHHVTAMAFLPGRGVIQWDITGKTPEQAKEAQIEAMGLADARAVQREIDAANAEREAEAAKAQAPASGSPVQSGLLAFNSPSSRPAQRVTAAIPLNRTARAQGGVLGVKNGEEMKGKPRMYAFAAVSGRGVGLNVLHDDTGWKNGGLTTDRGGFTGQKQAGLAWRVGRAQASLSYVQQKNKTQILGMQSDKDHRVMLTMNMTPQTVLSLFEPAR